ncbi:hypothetical protein GCM10023193_20810 [Planotetraspora kaengkrachanensis]
MAVNDSVDPGAWLARQIEAGDPDLLRSMVKSMAEALMPAEADSVVTSSGVVYESTSARSVSAG